MDEKIYHIYQTPKNRELISLQICGTTYPNKNYRILRESSICSCMEYVDEGSGIVQFDKKSATVKKGDTYFLYSGHYHHYWSDPETPWKKYFINISGRLFHKMVEGYNLKNHFHFPGLDTKSEFKEIIRLAKNYDTDNTYEITKVVMQLLHKMYIHSNDSQKYNDTASQMSEFLEKKVTESFHLSELCAYTGYSESQLIKIFKASFNTTPYVYFMNLKIELAKDMLRNTTLPIKHIAHYLKFADEYYFSNVFKKNTGVSPKQFRIGIDPILDN